MRWRWRGEMSISPGLTWIFFITHPIPGLEPSNPRPTVVAPYVPCSGVLEKKTIWDVFVEAQAPKTSTYYWIFLLKKSDEITDGLMLANLVAPQFSYIPRGGRYKFLWRNISFHFFWRSIGSPATADPMASKTRVKCSKTGAGGHCIAWRKKDRKIGKNVQRVCLNWKKHGNHFGNH